MGPMMLLRWTASGNKTPLPVHGPTGVEGVIAGFNAAYALDIGYRTAHHGTEIPPPAAARATPMPLEIPAAPTVVYDAEGLRVPAFPVDPPPVRPAAGYPFDSKGRNVVL